MANEIVMTKEGYDDLVKELAELKTTRRAEISDARRAREKSNGKFPRAREESVRGKDDPARGRCSHDGRHGKRRFPRSVRRACGARAGADRRERSPKGLKGEKIRPFSGEKRKRRVKFEICGKNLLHFFENNVKYFRVNFLSGKEGKFAEDQ